MRDGIRLNRARQIRVWLLELIGLGTVSFWAGAATAATTAYTVLHHFTFFTTPPDGYLPAAALTWSGGTLYGSTCAGLTSHGTLFRINTDGTGYAVIKEFRGGSDGDWPGSRLVVQGTNLYGTTSYGGITNHGTIFRVGSDGSNFNVLMQFPGWSQGDGPDGGIVVSGTTIYGSTTHGGIGPVGFGTLYRLNTDGSGYAVLRQFAGADGANPTGDLLLFGNVLYGTTQNGGTTNCGTVFKVNTDGSAYTILKSFSGPDGATPVGGLTLSGGRLFGTTSSGGQSNLGTIFVIDLNGDNFSVLRHCTFNEGANPTGVLIVHGTRIYGATPHGGISMPYGQDGGTLFQMNTDGSGYQVLRRFTAGNDGQNPGSGPVLADSRLFGTTQAGGTNNNGIVFSLGLPPEVLTAPTSMTTETSSSAEFHVRAVPPGVSYQWSLNAASIDGATNSSLQLTNVQFSNAGSYTVAITNDFGAVTSGPAMLQVIAPVERRPVPGLVLSGQPGSVAGLEYVNSLSADPTWAPAGNLTLTSPSQWYFDVQPVTQQRFYRLVQMDGPIPVRLQLPGMVPAITLSAPTGSALRVDYINVVGPTDAWLTLDTVVVSNGSQLYFDTSALGQPQRLYRLMLVP